MSRAKLVGRDSAPSLLLVWEDDGRACAVLAVRALSSLSSRGQGANDDSPAPDGRCDRAAAPSGSRLSTSAAKRLALTAHARRLPAESLNQSASLAPSWRPVGPTAVPARWSRRSRSRGWLAASCYLGLALSGLGGLAVQSRHHAARDRPCPAPSSLPALLAMEVHAEWGRPTEARRRDSPRDPLDGSGPSVLGPPPQPGGTRLLGHEVAELTIAKDMPRRSPRPSPTWRASSPRTPESSSRSTSSGSRPSPSACCSSSSPAA